jgi:hypothetical protein
MYEAPVITELGSVSDFTQAGTPNESFDGGSFVDFFGPRETS